MLFQKRRLINAVFFIGLLGLGCLLGFLAGLHHEAERLSLFPLASYNQHLDAWINPSDPGYQKNLLSTEKQAKHLAAFFTHYFGSHSPWNADYVNNLIGKTAPDDLLSLEQKLISRFSNENKPKEVLGYGANFRPYSSLWLHKITQQIKLSQFEHLRYQKNKRAITIANVPARSLPTEDPFFYSYKIAGEGYPFDYLQVSAIWAGTPVYILGQSSDQAWSLVLTPEFIAWVKTSGLATVSSAFIDTWVKTAEKTLLAITQTETPLLDEKGQFLLSAYVGSVFPAKKNTSGFKLLLPLADLNHQATIKYVSLSSEQAVQMPLSATPQHFAQLMTTLLGRPYGWGGLYFYNDCSAELKSLLTPFGIWLPRHSDNQVYAGKVVDLSTASQEQRLSYLQNHGHPFLTLVGLGGYIFMYLGNYSPPQSQTSTPLVLTYQNIWGLKPNPPQRRAVIGQAVLLPLLLSYPEDEELASLAARKLFQLSYLDEEPNEPRKLESNDLNALMGML